MSESVPRKQMFLPNDNLTAPTITTLDKCPTVIQGSPRDIPV